MLENARPLTTSEIAKLFTGVVGTMGEFHRRHDPDWNGKVAGVLEGALDPDAAVDVNIDDIGLGWASAISATVISLRGWCAENEIRSGISWVIRNLSWILEPPVVRPQN